MKEYWMAVVMLSVVGGILEEVLPGKSGMRAYVRLAAGLSVLLLLVTPFQGILSEIGAFLGESEGLFSELPEIHEEYESMFEGTMEELAAAEAEKRLQRALVEKFSLAERDVRAVLLKDEEGKIERVRVVLTGKAVFFDPYKITAYLNEAYGVPSDVVIGAGNG